MDYPMNYYKAVIRMRHIDGKFTLYRATYSSLDLLLDALAEFGATTEQDGPTGSHWIVPEMYPWQDEEVV